MPTSPVDHRSDARMQPLDYAAIVYLVAPLAIFFAWFAVWFIACPALAVIGASLWRLRPIWIPISRRDVQWAFGLAVLAALYL
jgi:hypothetical protein